MQCGTKQHIGHPHGILNLMMLFRIKKNVQTEQRRKPYLSIKPLAHLFAAIGTDGKDLYSAATVASAAVACAAATPKMQLPLRKKADKFMHCSAKACAAVTLLFCFF